MKTLAILLLITLSATSSAMQCNSRGARIVSNIINFVYDISLVEANRGWLENLDYDCPEFISAGITQDKVEQYKKLLKHPETRQILVRFGRDHKGNVNEGRIQEDLASLSRYGVDTKQSIFQTKVSQLRIEMAKFNALYESVESCPTLPSQTIKNVYLPNRATGRGWCYADAAAAITSNFVGQMLSPIGFALAFNMKGTEEQATTKEGGFISSSINSASEFKMLCRLEDFEDRNWSINGKIMTSLEIFEELRNGTFDISSEDFRGVFPKFQFEKYRQLSKPLSVKDLLPIVCPPLNITLPLLDYQHLSMDHQENAEKITESLKQSRPVGIGFRFSMYFYDDQFQPELFDPKVTGHAGVIVGQRFNTQRRQCEYVVRDLLWLASNPEDRESHRHDGLNMVVSREAFFRLGQTTDTFASKSQVK